MEFAAPPSEAALRVRTRRMPRRTSGEPARRSCATNIPSYRGVACVLHCDDPCPEQIAQPMLRELLRAPPTAAGKVRLAFRQPWRDSVLASPLRRYTERTITAPFGIERAATQIRRRGYAIDNGEYRSGRLGIAVPVFVGGQVPAALAVTGPQGAGIPHFGDALIQRVVAAAAALTVVLRETEAASDGRTS